MAQIVSLSSSTPSLTTSPLALCSVHTGGLVGLDYQPIVVEVCSRRGPSNFQLAGLAEAAVRESRIRLGSALSRLGLNLDEYSLVVNLAPANVRKSGSGLDLALAVGILRALGHVPEDEEKNAVFFGEVALDGSLRPIPGVLPLLDGAAEQNWRCAFVPEGNANEASHVSGCRVHAVNNLTDLVAHLRGSVKLPLVKKEISSRTNEDRLDLLDVRGQPAAKRALCVAAAGNHHLLLVGPPGAGKSLLARRLPGILPPLDQRKAMETTKIHSVAGVLNPRLGIVSIPPFRAPHHSVSEVGLIGGGSLPRPGEISLAHNGVLFLDELPEFRRTALEALRQPLEDHEVSIIRARFKANFPSRPLLVAAMNPCPCGNFGNPRAICRCATQVRLRYLSRISGPLLDRIDLHVVVPPADLKSWRASHRTPPDGSSGEAELSSATVRELVLCARRLQEERQASGSVCASDNATLSLEELERVAEPDKEGRRLLDLAIDKKQLSARSYVRVLRIMRTLADMSECERPRVEHVGEALRYRITDLSDC